MLETILSIAIPLVASLLGSVLVQLAKRFGIETTAKSREDVKRLLAHLVANGVRSVEQWRKVHDAVNPLSITEAQRLQNRVVSSVIVKLGRKGVKEAAKKLGIQRHHLSDYLAEMVDSEVRTMQREDP